FQKYKMGAQGKPCAPTTTRPISVVYLHVCLQNVDWSSNFCDHHFSFLASHQPKLGGIQRQKERQS
ncbi:MAG: hypothetical protein NTW35_00275, partial [Candidatus Nomurabacteria bacterium]|nr:hypothetical protein [Candidatus Nomurabacteria bacterium]